MKKEKEFLDLEVGIAKGEDALAGGVLQYGKASNFACPECSGVLTEFREDSIVRYRCHTGHAHTLESLLSGVNDNIEDNLWKAMRGMEESLLLLEDIAERLARVGDTQRADKYLQRANRLKDRSQRVKRVIQAHQKPAASAFSEKS